MIFSYFAVLYVKYLTFGALLVVGWTAGASMELLGCYRDDCGADGDAGGVAEEKIGAN